MGARGHWLRPASGTSTWVAVETGSGGEEVVVGAAALAPASDPDLDASTTVELLLLTVDPDAPSAADTGPAC